MTDADERPRKKNGLDASVRISLVSLFVSLMTFLLTYVDKGSVSAVVSMDGAPATYAHDLISIPPETLHLTLINNRSVPSAFFAVEKAVFGTVRIGKKLSFGCPVDFANTSSLIDFVPSAGFTTTSVSPHEVRTFDVPFPRRDLLTAAMGNDGRYGVECLRIKYASVGGKLSTFEVLIGYFAARNLTATEVTTRRLPFELFPITHSWLLFGGEWTIPEGTYSSYATVCTDLISPDCDQVTSSSLKRVEFSGEMMITPEVTGSQSQPASARP